ncbi:putative O-methyltransferase YrrM [Salinibacter ruber]|uniref:class I SAM-dependent methyltransferase n=1 Tax=Salinibacter ruber TaxID=146919 RepID=UPI002166CA92|nr:class I SAM-dependent methyltransferase [Salinibacter ruber]MCS4086115.1 putative O-methyltransferase YrrM [Salinibacter ruber]
MANRGAAALHALSFYLGLDEADTQTTGDERRAIREYASGKERAVEIGVYEGVNTCLIAEAIQDEGVLYAIDPFFTGVFPFSWCELIAHQNLRRSGYTEKVQFVKSLSWEACEKIEGAFDFVFIDGDHSLEGIQRDWAGWSQRMSPGGIIALHDTAIPEHDPSVKELGSYQYFQEEIRSDERFKVVDRVDSLSVLERK